MTLRRLALIYLSAISALAIICGCGERIENEAEAIDAAQQLSQQAFELYQGGNTNGAIQLLEEALTDDSIAEQSRQRLFGTLINLYLTCDKPETAEKKTLAAAADSPQYLIDSAGSIMRYYQYKNNTEAQLNWCTTLVGMDIPEQTKSHAFYQLLSIYQSSEQLDKALELIENDIQQFTADIRNNILKSLTYQTMRSKDFEGAEKILALARKLFPEDKDLQTISLIAGIDLLFDSEQWDKGIASVKETANQLDDNSLRGVLMRATSKLNKANEVGKSSELCRSILTDNKDMPSTCKQAATTYITNAKENPSETVERLSFLHESQLDSGVLFSCYRNCFYDVLGKADSETLQQLKDISKSISASLQDERNTSYMKTLSLELAFVMEDYERSIELVRSGIEGKDEQWEKLAIAKMSAHQALKKNAPEEAIKHFREFMELVAQDSEPQSDPTTGILHTREMLLGRNAKRIGDIYLSIDKKEEAAESYSEAEQYYIDAKQNIDKKHTKSLKLIEQEQAEVLKAKSELAAS